VVKLRYSLAHIHYTIHHHTLKLLKILLSLTVPSIVILSLKRFNAEEAWVMQKNMRGNKKGQVPETSKKKEKE